MSEFNFSRRIVDGKFVGFWHDEQFQPFVVTISPEGEIDAGDHEVTNELEEYAKGVCYALGTKPRISAAEVKMCVGRRHWMAVVQLSAEELAIATPFPGGDGWYYTYPLGAGRWFLADGDICVFDSGVMVALAARIVGDPDLYKQLSEKIASARRQQLIHDRGRRQRR